MNQWESKWAYVTYGLSYYVTCILGLTVILYSRLYKSMFSGIQPLSFNSSHTTAFPKTLECWTEHFSVCSRILPNSDISFGNMKFTNFEVSNWDKNPQRQCTDWMVARIILEIVVPHFLLPFAQMNSLKWITGYMNKYFW